MLARGQGVPADVPGALGLMEQAAAQGHVDALNALGFFSTQDVEGRPADWAKAREYFEKSAELGECV